MVAFVIAQLLSYVCPNVFAICGHDRFVPNPVDESLAITINVFE
jgi:hypothetical protein